MAEAFKSARESNNDRHLQLAAHFSEWLFPLNKEREKNDFLASFFFICFDDVNDNLVRHF